MNFRKWVSFISFILLPVTLNYFSPVLIVQGSFEKTFTGMHIIFALMLIGSIFFGGAWCSYICPFGALQDIVPAKKEKSKLPNLKWFTGSIFIMLIVIPIMINGFDKVIIPYHMTDNLISVSSFGDLVRYYIISGSIILITVLLGKRSLCKYICPMYMFNYIGIKISKFFKIPSLKISADSNKCVKCGQCTKNCIKGLNVTDMVRNNKWNNDECIKCGECIKACKCDVLKMKWK